MQAGHRYEATIRWVRDEGAFTDQRYTRAHTWSFDGGTVVPASASPLHVPRPYAIDAAIDPEEALVAAAASCHMLFFLWLAAKSGFVVDAYDDAASGVMGTDERGRLAITHIALRPLVRYGGARQPTRDEEHALHHDAHERCYVANSLRSEIEVAPRRGLLATDDASAPSPAA